MNTLGEGLVVFSLSFTACLVVGLVTILGTTHALAAFARHKLRRRAERWEVERREALRHLGLPY